MREKPGSKRPQPQPPKVTTNPAKPPGLWHPDRILCPICGAPGVERRQKWFCSRCGHLLRTCCD